ncbi:hypothetical protein [Pollutibacter soli]|uniref:hypothetical protein n=1 Tax=Pollutibacter soli TaxID=3034157 RepID=UPI0030131F44
MFLSNDDLKLAYGVDLQIGKYFVDREVPKQNSYWEKRHLYIVPQPGYIFVPIYVDLVFRIGIRKELLLSDDYVLLMERIMDSAARQEKEKIPMHIHIEECISYASKVSVNTMFLDELNKYFNNTKGINRLGFGSPFPALTRADAFLFSLCVLNFDEATAFKLVEAWNALMTFFLVKDDLLDIKEDLQNNEANAVLEAGLNDHGAKQIADLLDQSYESMMKYNPVLANRIDHTRATTDIPKLIAAILSDQQVKTN